LEEWGIQDSKNFGSSEKGKRTRASLAGQIACHFEHSIIVISSDKVDRFVTETSLNYLEQITARKIIDTLPADKVVLDGENLFAPLVNDHVVAKNKADQDYLSVAAASILAKSERDRLFGLICDSFRSSFGEINGGGYANKKTLEFVRWYLTSKGELPGFYRKSYNWKALQEVFRY